MKVSTSSTLRILVVEEDEYFILHLTTLIENIGYSVVHVVRNQAETLSAIAEFLPDLVVMGLDSSEKKLLFKYAQGLKNRTPPILFITNFNKATLYTKQGIGSRATTENFRKAIKQKMVALETQQRIGNNVLKYKGFLFFFKKGVFYKIKIATILYIKSVDDYALIYTEEKVVTIFAGLKDLKDLLKEDLFVQVHRSHLLNAQMNIASNLDKNYFYINEEYVVPLSRRLKKEVLGWFRSKNIPIPYQF